MNAAYAPVVWLGVVEHVDGADGGHDLVYPLGFEVCVPLEEAHGDVFIADGALSGHGTLCLVIYQQSEPKC